jgi:ABC-type dipeptide/oligopeptide/nickel transport system permease component
MESRTAYILRRLAQIPFVLLVVTIIIFGLIHVTPGDPIQIMLGMDTSKEAEEALRKEYYLDRSLPVQYIIWVKNAVCGDLGESIRLHWPVTSMIAERFPISLQLATAAIVFALVISLPAGILSAVRRNTWIDYLFTGVSIAGVSIPNFALALLLIFALAVKLGWFPITGIGSLTRVGGSLWDTLGPFVLPAIALGAQQTAILGRLLRSSMIDVLSQDYIRTAKAKGCSSLAVLVIHALKNALIPVVTMVAMQYGYLIGITITIEFIFAIPGMGFTLLNAVVNRDFPVIQGFTLAIAMFFIIANIVADFLYTVLDPRIRY